MLNPSKTKKGDVDEVKISGNVMATITEDVKGLPDGTKYQIVIENVTTPLITQNSINTTSVRTPRINWNKLFNILMNI